MIQKSESGLKKSVEKLNSKIEDLNKNFVSGYFFNCLKAITMEKFTQRLQNDFSTIRDAIFKYFVYQTSFIKNIEYDAGNIIKALEDEKVRRTVKEEVKMVKKIFF